jgi:hypothetical protein
MTASQVEVVGRAEADDLRRQGTAQIETLFQMFCEFADNHR